MTGVFHHDASPRVLVVDDEPFVRRLIRAQLHQMDILEITEASNGQEALTHLDHHPVDLLVCDWNMPKISGLDVLIKVRQQASLADLPVLMVTAEINATQVMDAIQSGVTSYLAKPFQPRVLRAHINICLAWRAQRLRQLAREATIKQGNG